MTSYSAPEGLSEDGMAAYTALCEAIAGRVDLSANIGYAAFREPSQR